MTARTCTACDQPVHNQRAICKTCTHEVRMALSSQAAYLEDLETELARQVCKTAPNDGGKSATTPLPYNPDAGNLIARQRSLLVSWCRELIDDGVIPAWPADTIPAMACAIEAQLRHIVTRDDAGMLVQDFRRLTKDIVQVIDLPEFRQVVTVGPCPEITTDDRGDTDHCPGDVRAYSPAEESKPGWTECPACGKKWDSTQWTRLGRRVDARREELDRQRRMAAEFAKGAA